MQFFSFYIPTLQQLCHTGTILRSCIIWISLFIRSNSNNISSIFFSPAPYLKPKYIVESYELRTFWILKTASLKMCYCAVTRVDRLSCEIDQCCDCTHKPRVVYRDISGSKRMVRGIRALQVDYSKESADINDVLCPKFTSWIWLLVLYIYIYIYICIYVNTFIYMCVLKWRTQCKSIQNY